MKRVCSFKNGIVYVVLPNDYNNLKKVTENFLRNVMKERGNNGYSNKSGTIYKK